MSDKSNLPNFILTNAILGLVFLLLPGWLLIVAAVIILIISFVLLDSESNNPKVKNLSSILMIMGIVIVAGATLYIMMNVNQVASSSFTVYGSQNPFETSPFVQQVSAIKNIQTANSIDLIGRLITIVASGLYFFNYYSLKTAEKSNNL